MPGRLIAIPMRSRRSVATFAPPLLDPNTLRAAAQTVIEAAVAAGAQFADVRLNERREFRAGDAGMDGLLRFTYGCGLRVRVNGREAFVGSLDLSHDGLVQTASCAVAMARQLPPSDHASSFLSTPNVTGEWVAPLEIDPFAVSPDDHVFISHGFTTLARRWNVDAGGYFHWESENRIFASSAGSLVTQRWTRCWPNFGVGATTWRDDRGSTSLAISSFAPYTGGMEAILGPERHEALESAADEVAMLVRSPIAVGEVGRRPVVMDGHATAMVLGTALVPSLSAARLIGEEQDGAGTSFLTSAQPNPGQSLFAPSLEMWVEQEATQYGAARWDDEGVATRAFPLISAGTITNVLGTRTTIPAIAEAPELRGTVIPRTPSVPGVAFASDITLAPGARPPVIGIRPASSDSSLAALIATMQDGLIVRGGSYANLDQQGANGMVQPRFLIEVRRGVVVRRLIDTRLEFATRKLCAAITTVGDPSTVQWAPCTLGGGMLWNATQSVVKAPAMHFREINVVPNRAYDQH